MDIPNLSASPQTKITSSPKLNLGLVALMLGIGLVVGLITSRFTPASSKTGSLLPTTKSEALSTENIKTQEELVVGKLYGNVAKNFKDSAVGTVEKGSINGEGTHILNREGGITQRASLTSSSVDLDLFVGRKVEVKGETNTSTKTGWLLDVGTVKILE